MGPKRAFFEHYSHEPYIAVARFWRIAGLSAPQWELTAGHIAITV